MRERNSFVLGVLALATVSANPVSQAMAQSQPVLKSIVQFDGTNGSDAVSDLIQLPNGTFVGVTLAPPNRPKAQSTIYQLKADGTIQVLYRLAADGSQGIQRSNAFLNNGLTQASDGKLYGIMNQGGSAGHGLVYRFTPGGAFESLYSFQLTDGSPEGKLVQALDGNLYGVTQSGGVNGLGTIFRIGLDGSYTIAYEFGAGDIGGQPASGVAAHPNGLLYGSVYGIRTLGANIFQFDPVTREAKLLGVGSLSTGTPPVVGRDGGLYFLASACVGCPASFVARYGTDGNGPQDVYDFPASQLGVGSLMIQASDGNFIGVGVSLTSVRNVVYEVNPSTQVLTLSPFPVATGTGIVGNVVVGANGHLVGALATTAGAASGFGALLGLFPALPKPVPSIIGFYPVSASAGDTVTLLGSYFVGTTGVSINGHSASFTVKGSGAVQFVVPLDATSGTVSISNQGGSAVSATSLIVG